MDCTAVSKEGRNPVQWCFPQGLCWRPAYACNDLIQEITYFQGKNPRSEVAFTTLAPDVFGDWIKGCALRDFGKSGLVWQAIGHRDKCLGTFTWKATGRPFQTLLAGDLPQTFKKARLVSCFFPFPECY